MSGTRSHSPMEQVTDPRSGAAVIVAHGFPSDPEPQDGALKALAESSRPCEKAGPFVARRLRCPVAWSWHWRDLTRRWSIPSSWPKATSPDRFCRSASRRLLLRRGSFRLSVPTRLLWHLPSAARSRVRGTLASIRETAPSSLQPTARRFRSHQGTRHSPWRACSPRKHRSGA